jgi:hypothetical protein
MCTEHIKEGIAMVGSPETRRQRVQKSYVESGLPDNLQFCEQL